MINWEDPDYKAAGHFYAVVNKITVKCADPQKPGPTDISYKYSTNATANTPSILFSNQTTMLNDASPTVGSSLTKRGAWFLAAGGLLASFVA
jgi:hypothetical protein